MKTFNLSSNNQISRSYTVCLKILWNDNMLYAIKLNFCSEKGRTINNSLDNCFY